VVKLGRGGPNIGVSRPRPIGIRASPPDSGVVPFSSRSRRRQIRAPNVFSGHFAFAAWILERIQAPTSPGPWEQAIETTMPTGLAVARGQSRAPAQGLTSRNRYRMGRFLPPNAHDILP
jgi:hypothetical protein